MHLKSILHRIAPAFFVLIVASCEDPSNVGLGLVGGEGGEPIVTELALSSLEMVSNAGLRDNVARHLAGQVDDPIMGQFSATAYVDFLSNTALDQAYVEGTISKAILRLEPSYVYGDTLQEITLALHESMKEFTAAGNTMDSIPPVGPELLQFSFMPTDTLVSVELPAEWVAAKDADLRSTSFGNLFYGFQLAPVSGNAIVGFLNTTASQSALRGFVESDGESIEETYAAAKSITHFTRTSPPQSPPGRMVIQNGVGPRLRLNVDLSQLEDIALNRAVVHIATDSLALTETPNFVRPLQENLALYGIVNDSSTVLLAINPVGSDGSLNLVSETLRSVLQQFLLGVDPYDHYEIRFSTVGTNNIDALAFYDSTSVETAPQLVLTYTSVQ